jgi:ribulose-bisphosphate carboxylase large chain
MIPRVSVALSGERFRVAYRLAGGEAEALALANDIRNEQTVEFPTALVPLGDIAERIVGQIESYEPAGPSHGRAVISYAVETTGFSVTQFLNVAYGNFSMKTGARVESIDLPESLAQALGGPRFGQVGLRSRLAVPRRPLLCTALKPMGLPPSVLADLAYQIALGGIDIIKDDHGLADQSFAPFAERVERCVAAVERANRETGEQAIYMPNVSADGELTVANALRAKAAGAGGILVIPALVGFGAMARLAADDRIDLPIFSHPAFGGSLVTSPDSGISYRALYGQITRLAGADGTIYPNFGGRFTYSREDCRAIAEATAEPLGGIKDCFPVPGGGMQLARVSELLEFYGNDVVLLVGGGLFQAGPDLVENCREFRKRVERGTGPQTR